ncbi:hypothetical protein BH10PLA1_BH10PLA1_17130 [soil metagenome]
MQTKKMRGKRVKWLLAAASAASGVVAAGAQTFAATTGFNQTGAGPYDYNVSGNWVSGNINGVWDTSLTLTANQTVVFGADTALSTGLSISYAGAFTLALTSDSATPRTVILGGDILSAPGLNVAVTIGDATNVLNLDLGGATRFINGGNNNKTINVINSVGNGSLTRGFGLVNFSGAVTLGTFSTTAAGTTNFNGNTSFTGAFSVSAGVVNNNGNGTYGAAIGISAGTLNLNGTTTSSSGITVSGGTLNLNTGGGYTGGTNITGGIVNVNAAGNLGGNTVGNNVSVSGAVLNLGAATNLGANQTLTIGSTSSALGVLGVAFNSVPTFTQNGTGPIVLGINTTGFTAASSQATFGSGTNYFGSSTSGTYAGTSLAGGTDGVFRLGGGGGTLTVTNAVLTGASPLLIGYSSLDDGAVNNSGGTVVLQGDNSSFTGNTTIQIGQLKLSTSNGSLANSNITIGLLPANQMGGVTSTLFFDSSANGVTGTTRANSVTNLDGILAVQGNSSSNSIDTITNALTIEGRNGGLNIVQLTPNASRNTRLTIGSLDRANGGVVLIRSSNGLLGNNTIASQTLNTTNIQITGTAPTLIGAGGAIGTKTMSIIPWAIGGTTNSDGGSTFVTYDSGYGIHTLTASELESTTASITGNTTPTSNVRLAGDSGTLTITGTATVNSLILLGGSAGGTKITGGTLKVTSGAILLPGGNGATTIDSNVDFGTAQGVIGVTRGKNSTSAMNISGSGGVVIYQVNQQSTGGSGGTSNNLSGTAHTFTGNVYILSHVVLNGASNFTPNVSDSGRTGDTYVYGLFSAASTTQINGLYGSGIIDNGTVAAGDGDATSTYDGTFVSGSNITKIGNGTLTLTSGASSTIGITTINAGNLSINTLANGGTSSSIGAATNASTKLVINGGTLRYTGGATSTDHLFQVGGTTDGGVATIDASGTGALAFTNTGFISYGTTGLTNTAESRTLNLTGSNTAMNSLAAVIKNNGTATNGNSTVSLVKAGAGTWSITGNNTYTGGTTVSGGRLLVNNTAANSSGTGTGNVTVASGGLLGGNGTINGNITVQAGGTINAGNSVGVLTETGNLTVNGKLQAAVGQGTNTADRLNVFGAVNINGATLEFISSPAGPYVNPTPIVLIDNDSSDAIVGTFAGQTRDGNDSFTLSTGPVQYTLYYSYNSSDGNLTSGNDLAVSFQSIPEPTSLSFLGLGVGGLLTRRRRTKKAKA